MRKTNKSEGKIKVLRGPEAEVLNQHFAKTGKYAVSDFSEEEREALDSDLNEVRAEKNVTHTDEPLDQDGGDK